MGEHRRQDNPDKMSREELVELSQRCANGDTAAREQLILSHLYLVESLVPQYLHRGVEWEDLYQDGCYGLIQAIDHYDPERGAHLSTYATYWINKRLKKAVREQTIFTPITPKEGVFYALQRYHIAANCLSEQLGRYPTVEELANSLKFSVKKVRELQRSLYSYVSLDNSKYFHENAPSEYILPISKLSPSAEEEALNSMHLMDISQYGVDLTLREEEALRRHLGFTPSGEPEPFIEMSAATGWSMEVLRRDYLNAIRKIREKIPQHFTKNDCFSPVPDDE